MMAVHAQSLLLIDLARIPLLSK